MFYPFTIQSSVISQLQLETGTYYSATEDPDKWTRKAQLRQYLSSTNGLVDGKALKEVLFPKGKYHIFLSHSHEDLKMAQYLKAWFNINCGLKCFIDANVWENAYDLLMELDNKYSKNTTGNYDYDKCIWWLCTYTLTKNLISSTTSFSCIKHSKPLPSCNTSAWPNQLCLWI